MGQERFGGPHESVVLELPDGPMSRVWGLPDERPWIHERLEEAWFLFNPLSNETHVLNDVTMAILDLLAGGGVSEERIVSVLSESGILTGADPLPTCRALLNELDRQGLIVPVRL